MNNIPAAATPICTILIHSHLHCFLYNPAPGFTKENETQRIMKEGQEAHQNMVKAQRGQSSSIKPILLHLKSLYYQLQFSRSSVKEKGQKEENLGRRNEEKVEMASHLQNQISPKLVPCLPVRSLSAKRLESSSGNRFLLPILHFPPYELPHCLTLHCLPKPHCVFCLVIAFSN